MLVDAVAGTVVCHEQTLNLLLAGRVCRTVGPHGKSSHQPVHPGGIHQHFVTLQTGNSGLGFRQPERIHLIVEQHIEAKVDIIHLHLEYPL